MKVLFLVDGRSPIALNWIRYFVEAGNHQVSLISTYPCDHQLDVQTWQVPVGFTGGMQGGKNEPTSLNPTLSGRVQRQIRRTSSFELLRMVRHWLTSFELNRHVQPIRQLIEQTAPDLVHAMRIPFEGIVAAKAIPAGIPLLVSVWGNDFTLQAQHYPFIARQTRQTLARANGLHADCQRDIRLGQEWGFARHKPTIVLPGSGGIQGELFRPGPANETLRQTLAIPAGATIIINPRGIRDYVRNDLFFQAIPKILAREPNTFFLCSNMQGNSIAENWVRRLNLAANVRLLPQVPRDQMADYFRLAQIAVSPSLHDGTPNTLLEAMACGCFPVASDIESIREWLEPGLNALLFDPNDVEAQARALLQAINNQPLRLRAINHNQNLIADRAEYQMVMQKVESFYLRLVN